MKIIPLNTAHNSSYSFLSTQQNSNEILSLTLRERTIVPYQEEKMC